MITDNENTSRSDKSDSVISNINNQIKILAKAENYQDIIEILSKIIVLFKPLKDDNLYRLMIRYHYILLLCHYEINKFDIAIEQYYEINANYDLIPVKTDDDYRAIAKYQEMILHTLKKMNRMEDVIKFSQEVIKTRKRINDKSSQDYCDLENSQISLINILFDLRRYEEAIAFSQPIIKNLELLEAKDDSAYRQLCTWQYAKLYFFQR